MSNHRPIPELTEADLKRFWSNADVRGPDDCWEWTAGKLRDYGGFGIDSKNFLAHRVSYFIEYGVDPGDECVCHSCDNPPCCNPAHLWLGTVGDNNRDMIAKGRQWKGEHPKGEQTSQAKLTDEIVQTIRQSRETHQALAEKYGVGVTTLTSARKRETWKHIKRQEGDYQPADGHSRGPKLTEKDVREIRKSNKSLRKLAKQYGVHAVTIHNVRHRETWKHVK